MNNTFKNKLITALLAVLIALVFQSFSLYAQETTTATTESSVDPVAVHQALLDLTNPWTIMCIAAHPDDEDGTSLIVMRHKFGAHTVSLFSTYGEGGQNAVGPELYEELGVIRARETMAAAEIQGSEPHFLGLKDFGFSKSADEAFRIWGHDEALRRMVLNIRQLRPDVIITNHDTTSGHGHHQATGRLLLEAFEVAADPQRFPEQLKNGIQPWQVKRVFVRARGSSSDANVVLIDPNERDAARGTTFAEQALQALQKHQTQGPWPKTIADMARFRNSPDGRLPMIRYQLVKEAKDAEALPKNAATFSDGLKLPESEVAKLSPPKIDDRPLPEFTGDSARVLQALVQARKSGLFTSGDSSDAPRFQLMNGRLDQAFAAATGATLTISPDEWGLIPGTTNSLTLNLGNVGTIPIGVRSLTLTAWGQERPLVVSDQLPPGTETPRTIDVTVPLTATISVPAAHHLYDGHLFGEQFTAHAIVDIDGAAFRLHAPEHIDIVPAVEIRSISPNPYVWATATSGNPLTFSVGLTNHEDRAFEGTISVGDSTIGTGQRLSLAAHESTQIKLSSNGLPSQLGVVDKAGRRRRNTASNVTLNVTIRTATSNSPVTVAPVEVVKAQAAVTRGIRVGYVPSFDQTIETSLRALGVNADKLNVADISTTDLSPYQTIVIDNRGYEAHPELIAANERLLNFVRDGGTLIVFYHKDNEWNPNSNRKRPQLAPYPIILDDSRVTDENATVTFLLPRHPLLNFPNRITQNDFTGWIQERGLYYPKEWDEKYAALFSMKDPGEQPLKGGLLAADYGKGKYIYTSVVWYRQLREGLPGAYRMFANMLSYGHR